MAETTSYSEAISTLDESLKRLLWEGIEEDSVAKSIITNESDITISSPDDASGKLSIFLYKISENSYLRNHPLEINDGEIKGNPTFLDLFYLITPNTEDNINDHIIMGKIIQIINDNHIIKKSYFKQDNLKLLLNSLSIDDLNKIWSMTSGSKPYKLSISIEITPLKIESMKTEEIKIVDEVKLKFKGKNAIDRKTLKMSEEFNKNEEKSIDIIEFKHEKK